MLFGSLFVDKLTFYSESQSQIQTGGNKKKLFFLYNEMIDRF